MKKKNIPSSPRLVEFKKKQQRARRNRALLVLVAVVLFILGLSFLASWSRVNVGGISIVGNKIIDTDTIESVVHEDLAGKYLWIIPKTNFLFYPKQKILTDLENNFKRLKNISVDIKESNTLEIKVSERTALYTWCGVEKTETIDENEKCYFLDDSGYIFDEAPFFSGDVYFRFYGANTSTGENPDGSYYSPDSFLKLISFKNSSEKVGLHPISMVLTKDNEIQMFLASGKNSKSPVVLFKLDTDVSKMAENLQTALGTDPFKTKFNKNYSALEYVDLRFGNKVYYKFKNEAAPVIPTTVDTTTTQ